MATYTLKIVPIFLCINEIEVGGAECIYQMPKIRLVSSCVHSTHMIDQTYDNYIKLNCNTLKNTNQIRRNLFEVSLFIGFMLNHNKKNGN